MDTDLREYFQPAAGLTYLDTATYGLPPTPTIEAMTEALGQWQQGTAFWIDDWDIVAERARQSFAELIGVPTATVSLQPSASVGVGLVAASLTAADRVVVPDDDFTSVLFPLLVAEQRGATITQVPFESLVDSIAPATTLVAFSSVQMQTGRTVALDAVLDRAAEIGARVLIDASHGLPFVEIEGAMARADFVVCVGYKHLLSPRGTAFLVARSEHHEQLAPWNANWRAADDPYGRYFGGPLTLAPDATRFDVSVAWHPWLGAAVSLDLLAGWSQAGHLRRPVDLARHLAERLGVDWGGSTLVCAPVADLGAAQVALDEARITVAIRGGGVRLSTHVYTSQADIDRAVAALEPHVAPVVE